jgi:threonine/homoserine/homoserine lactone efflux protein
MLASSGATHGLKPTLPHLAGVCIGFAVMVQIVGLGLAAVLLASPMLQLAMKIASCAYLLWLALQIARSSALAGAAARKPMTFLQACAFQWINPKAWLTAVGAISAYTAGRGAQLYLQVAILALICLVVAVPATFIWAAFGAVIRKWLRAPEALRAFNVMMALLLAASTVPILIEIGGALRG